MNLYKLKISQLRALVTVAEHGNFGAAALDLEVSQSGLSHAIATLEAELGVQLLHRGRYGAHLTSVGERIVTHAKTILATLSDIVTEAERAKGLEGGSVRIATLRSIATHILPKVLASFHRHFPHIKVIIDEFAEASEIEQSLRQGYADIGLTHLSSSIEFETFELLRDDYVLLLPPGEEVKNRQLTWKQLATLPLIVSSAKCCSELFRPYLEKAEVPLQIAYEIREDSTILSLVRQKLGAAILPRLAAEPIPEGIQVCALPFYLERAIKVATLKDAMHTPAVFAFLDTLRDFSHRTNPAIASA